MTSQCVDGVCSIVCCEELDEFKSVLGMWQMTARAESCDQCYEQELMKDLVIAGMRGRYYFSFGGRSPVPVRLDSDCRAAKSEIEAQVKKEFDGKVLNRICNSFNVKLLPGGRRLSGSWKQVLEFAGGESVKVTYQIRATRVDN